MLWVYSITSYILTDPNLVLNSWKPYWDFQTYMWSHVQDFSLISFVFFLVISGSFITYLLIVRQLSVEEKLKQVIINQVKKKKVLYTFYCLLFLLPLLLSYNALSHDVFNYIFNARMVYLYKANPHIKVAQDFSSDLWTRFMHNTHTPAPYGYGWTILSLVPYGLGMGYFLPTWLIFRVFSVVSLFLLVYLLHQYSQYFSHKIATADLALLILNPLVLIEVVSNQHNDLWMIAPVIASIIILRKNLVIKKKILFSMVLMIVSISIKFATVVLVPLWFVIVLFEVKSEQFATYSNKKFKIPERVLQATKSGIADLLLGIVPLCASILLFFPLALPRSKQYLPWYLLWSLAWLPLVRNKTWATFLVLMSFCAMMRYLPWLYYGEYSATVTEYQLAITWIPGLLYLITVLFKKRNNNLGRVLKVI